ncbi:MAG TPA: hypothetical protein VED01_07290 [Burkholderiales bacterium]|nr:hypothetical protein [Burkholderiales bacterium]
MKLRAVLVLAAAAVIANAASAGQPAPSHNGGAATVCANATPTARYPQPSDACWVAFDVALARNAVAEAIAIVRTGCEVHRRADLCLLVSWISAPQRPVRPVRHSPTGLTVMQLARLADDIGVWEWDDALIGLIAREQSAQTSR